MADMNKRGPDCNDCDGEGGEGKRGERGERGKRGHRGHDGHDGPPGPQGPPPFPTAGVPVTTTIYARPASQGGSDTTGDGTSIATAYETFNRAILDVPRFIDAGTRWIIDITDLGTEVLPQDWSMPPIQMTADVYFIPDQSFLFAAPLTIRAYPKLALAPADAQVSAADAATVSVVGPGLTKITIASAGRGAWGPALKGKQIVRSSGNFSTASCIYDATPTELFLCNTPGSVNGGVGPLALAPGETIDIVEPSATLLAPPSDRGVSLVFTAVSINFQGIAMACTVPNVANGGMNLNEAIFPAFELCELNEPYFSGTGSEAAVIYSTTVSGYINGIGSRLAPSRCYFHDVGVSYTDPDFPNGQFGSMDGNICEWRSVVFEDCSPLETDPGLAEGFLAPATGWAFGNCLWINSKGNALDIASPLRLDLITCEINGSQAVAGHAGNGAGNGIMLRGPLKGTLVAVTGSGNAGIGLVTDDGVHAQVDAATTIGNADARAYKNGNNALVVVWPGAPFNDIDLSTLSRVWEP